MFDFLLFHNQILVVALPYACWLSASETFGSKLRAIAQTHGQCTSSAVSSVGIKMIRMLWSGIVVLITNFLCCHEVKAVEITLAGQYNPNDLSSYSRVVLAENLAYVAGGSGGVHVLDISQPANPVRIGGFATQAWDVALSGDYAVVANGGFQVFDISNPANPQLVGSYTNNFPSVFRVAVSSNYVYAVTSGGWDFGGIGLKVFDISNPAQPIPIWSNTNSSWWGEPVGGAVAVRSNHVYFGWGRVENMEMGGRRTSGAMAVLNVSNPTNPVAVSTHHLFAWVSDIAVSGNTAFLAYGGRFGTLWNNILEYGGLEVVNLTNPSAPTGSGGYSTNTPATGVAVSGNQVFLTGSSPRFVAFNILNATNVVPTGSYETLWYGYRVAFSNNYAYVTDGSAGLQILCVDCLRLSAITNRNILAGSLLSVTNTIQQGAFTGSPLYSLGPGAPLGVRINPTNGILHWLPTCEQGSTTNSITVRVTDSSQTNFSGTTTFTVTVDDCVQVRLGSSVVRAGNFTCLPVELLSSARLSNVAFFVAHPLNRFTNFSLLISTQQVAAVSSFNEARVDLLDVHLEMLTNHVLRVPTIVATLCFAAHPNQVSAFVPIGLPGVNAVQPHGGVVTNSYGLEGRVVVVGEETLLESVLSSDRKVHVYVYAPEGSTNLLETVTKLPAQAPWSPWQQVTTTNLYISVPLVSTNTSQFLRAVRQ